MIQTTSTRTGPRHAAELNAWTKLGKEEALEPELPIIDPHHHVWHDERGRYLFEELSEDVATGHNIIATVFVQTGINMYRVRGPAEMKPVGEVEFVNGIAAMSASGRFGKSQLCAGIVGFADLTLGDRVRPVLEAVIAAGGDRVCGIRHSMSWDPHQAKIVPHQVRHLALNPEFRKGFAHLDQVGLAFDAWLFHPQLPELIDLAKAFPNTRIVLNHVGGLLGIDQYAGKREEIFKLWSGYMSDLSKLPNVTVKTGGLGMPRCGWGFHLREMPPSSEELAVAWRPYIETCIEAFGPNRCMMESNFPVDKNTCGYDVLWNAMKRITKGASETEKLALYRDTAASVYRINLEG